MIKIKILTPLEASQMRPNPNWGGNSFKREYFDGIVIVSKELLKKYPLMKIEFLEELEQDD